MTMIFFYVFFFFFYFASDSNKRTPLVNLCLQSLVRGYKKIDVLAYSIVGLKKPA